MNSLDATKHVSGATPAGPAPHSSINWPQVFRSPKILDGHLDRLAIVYVRQSDPHQFSTIVNSGNANTLWPTMPPPWDVRKDSPYRHLELWVVPTSADIRNASAP
jgi:hypothetical protein